MLRISYKMQVICLVWGKYNSSIENKNKRDRNLVKPDSVWGDGKGFLPRRQDNPCLITTKIRLGKFSFGQVYFRFNSCYLVVRCQSCSYVYILLISFEDTTESKQGYKCLIKLIKYIWIILNPIYDFLGGYPKSGC